MNDNKVSNTDNQTAINDLIQSIQSKINLSQENYTSEENHNKENISDNKNPNQENNNNNNNKNLDLASMLNNLDISNMLNTFNSNLSKNNGNNKENVNSFNFSDIDPNTILRIQKLISNFNKSDPKKDLLRSLKPFLKKSRQDKIGEYITILTIIDALDIFGNKGSD